MTSCIYWGAAAVKIACMPGLQLIRAWIEDKRPTIFPYAQVCIEPKRRRGPPPKKPHARSGRQLHVGNQSISQKKKLCVQIAATLHVSVFTASLLPAKKHPKLERSAVLHFSNCLRDAATTAAEGSNKFWILLIVKGRKLCVAC